MNELYTRQNDLNITPPNKVTVIGLGGIGSWAALNQALTGTDKLYLVDPDIIETHNLNRTPFKKTDVGKNKAQAIAELIMERRPQTETVILQDRVQQTPRTIQEEMKESTVIDCRDSSEPLPDGYNPEVTAGYDGYSLTLHTQPDYESIWGEDTGYETTPSFLVPPQIAAAFITLLTSTDHDIDTEKMNTFNVNTLLHKLLKNETTENNTDEDSS